MIESKRFMGHKEKIVKLSEVEKRRLRFQLKEKAKIGRQKEDERREQYYK